MLKMNEPRRAYGAQEWYRDGELHREGGPAVVHADGMQEWYLNGVRHREDGPAVVLASGAQEWYLNGERHRLDGPALVRPDGYEAWYLNGERHRLDGPALVRPDGYAAWYLHGQRFKSESERQHAVALAEHGGFNLYRVAAPGQPVLYIAGCRRFSLSEAREHWCASGSNRAPFIQALADET